MGTPAQTLGGVLAKARLCHEPVEDRESFTCAMPLTDWTMLLSILGDLQRVPLDDADTLRAVFAALTGGEDPSENPVMEAEADRLRWCRARVAEETAAPEG